MVVGVVRDEREKRERKTEGHKETGTDTDFIGGKVKEIETA